MVQSLKGHAATLNLCFGVLLIGLPHLPKQAAVVKYQ